MKSMQEILQAAKDAAPSLGLLSTEQKNAALLKMADALEESAADILQANAKDVENAKGVLPDVMAATR